MPTNALWYWNSRINGLLNVPSYLTKKCERALTTKHLSKGKKLTGTLQRDNCHMTMYTWIKCLKLQSLQSPLEDEPDQSTLRWQRGSFNFSLETWGNLIPLCQTHSHPIRSHTVRSAVLILSTSTSEKQWKALDRSWKKSYNSVSYPVYQ